MAELFRQLVPRPPDASAVERPAARFVEVAARLGDEWTSLLRSAELVERVGGERRQDGERSAAAVLLPVVGGRSADDPARLVLIRRATHLRANPGEVAFAGGRLEPGESAEQAALREAREEIMLDPRLVRVVGRLPLVYRVTSPEGIAPFVATVEGWPEMAPNPAEVDGLLVVSLGELGDPGRYFEESWPMPDGRVRRMHFFRLEEDMLWGASAHILTLLLDRLAGAALEG